VWQSFTALFEDRELLGWTDNKNEDELLLLQTILTYEIPVKTI